MRCRARCGRRCGRRRRCPTSARADTPRASSRRRAASTPRRPSRDASARRGRAAARAARSAAGDCPCGSHRRRAARTASSARSLDDSPLDRLSLISRLRRVAPSSAIVRSSRSTASVAMCASVRRRGPAATSPPSSACVRRRWRSSAPADPSANVSSPTPNATRSATPKCVHSACRPPGTSKSCGEQRVACVHRSSATWSPSSPPSMTSVSAGCRRSSTRSTASGEHSSNRRSPDAKLTHAMPAIFVRSRGERPMRTAASRRSALSGSRPASASVPGVTMRTTSRATGPFAVAGSPICSQMATDSPCPISFARYASSAWNGTPAIGIGAPFDWPRAVSVMSSSCAARFASSWNSS